MRRLAGSHDNARAVIRRCVFADCHPTATVNHVDHVVSPSQKPSRFRTPSRSWRRSHGEAGSFEAASDHATGRSKATSTAFKTDRILPQARLLQLGPHSLTIAACSGLEVGAKPKGLSFVMRLRS